MNSEPKRCYKTVKIEKVVFRWNHCFVYKQNDWSYRKLHSHKTLHYLTFAHLSVTKMALEIFCCLAFWISVLLTTFKLSLSVGIPIYYVLWFAFDLAEVMALYMHLYSLLSCTSSILDLRNVFCIDNDFIFLHTTKSGVR